VPLSCCSVDRCPSARPVIISNPTVSKARDAALKFNVPEYTDSAMDVINHPQVSQIDRRSRLFA
jgi:myo-inositol 2-dehydrogenase / D-chiro-inositol 1-dehydrogenase